MMLEHRLFYLAGLLVIVLGIVGNWMYRNYLDYQEKLELDFAEEEE